MAGYEMIVVGYTTDFYRASDASTTTFAQERAFITRYDGLNSFMSGDCSTYTSLLETDLSHNFLDVTGTLTYSTVDFLNTEVAFTPTT
jgi:hypothetical protein